jgi:hypothetical protein
VLLVVELEPWLVHLEFQTSYDPDLPLRLQRYNTLVSYQHRLPVKRMTLHCVPTLMSRR